MASTNEQLSPTEALKALEWLWRFSLATPAIYMIVSIIVKRVAFPPEADGFWPLEPHTYRTVWIGALALAAVLTAIVVRLRAIRAEAAALARYRRLTFTMLILCDAIAFIGLAIYLVQGDAPTQGGLSLLSWIDYAIARPATRLPRPKG